MFRRKPQEPLSPPEFLVVGLGNPGPQYRHTRHNVGFDVVDALGAKHGIKVIQNRSRALTGVGKIGDKVALLVKPLTYMNLSGQSVAPLAKAHGIPPERVLVVADDLDLDVGRVRLKPKGSSGGHNGHKSIIHSLGSQEYPRIKIGIGKEGETIDHVLSRFSPEERVDIDRAVAKSVEGIEAFLSQGLDAALNRVNGG
jgi:peptidyl-tRNA hydrolase, PTH1 family